MSDKALSEILKTSDRIFILRYVAVNSSFTATDVVNATGKSKGLVSRYLHLLLELNYILADGRKYFWIENAETKALKRLLNIRFLSSIIFLPDWAGGIGIYGSFADGTNSAKSDLDVWVYVDSYSSDLELKSARLEKSLGKETGVETNILILTSEKLSRLKEDDNPFYFSLMKSTITLEGVSIERH
ncbi:MAG: nucleotidyltransferase domain-containing protein [Euryarchaeota archaeon]|nr:nucleotidyltransferase domain-containing protein [Euryarchaeota archaeon]